MERSEPTLVPEWLRTAGSVTGGGSSVPHSASSSSHADVPSLVHHLRNRNSKSIGDIDSPRSPFLERTSSSNSRRSSSNGSAKHAYSSFNRSHRDKDREREKDRSIYGDHWDRDSSDPIGSMLINREKDTLRRSHSMMSRKQGEILPRRAAGDLKNGGNSNHSNGNGLLSGPSVGSSLQKVVFEKDFPSLGSDDRPGLPDIARVSSPGLSSAVQSLPVGKSALIGGEGWTSALAEVPNVIGSTTVGSFSPVQTVPSSLQSGASSGMTSLNMAEALAQAPARTRTPPQTSVKTQRLEELAIKQSRQLIPVTPLMPKGSVLNSSDKSKPKSAVRTGEAIVAATKSGQQQSSSLHHANQSLPAGHVKSEASKTSLGKLLVLKPAWENGVSPSPKDVAIPANIANTRSANNQLAVTPSVASAPARSTNSPKERKAPSLNAMSGFPVEKRPTLSQTQSRNDFFNLLKKKTSTSISAGLSDSGPGAAAPIVEKAEATKEVISAPVSPHATVNGPEVTSNGAAGEGVERLDDVQEKDTSFNATFYADEAEVKFLRSLGWEENAAGDDEGLTEEEINAFYQECLRLRPSLKVCRGMQPKLSEMQATSLGEASSQLSSSDSGSEA